MALKLGFSFQTLLSPLFFHCWWHINQWCPHCVETGGSHTHRNTHTHIHAHCRRQIDVVMRVSFCCARQYFFLAISPISLFPQRRKSWYFCRSLAYFSIQMMGVLKIIKTISIFNTQNKNHEISIGGENEIRIWRALKKHIDWLMIDLLFDGQ